MSMRRIKARWIAKLLKARVFVVLTDKESVICLQGIDPEDINDFIVLAAQSAELQDFRAKLTVLIKDHDRAIKKLRGDAFAKPTSKRKVPKVQG